MVNRVELMTRRRYSFRASEIATGTVFDPKIWTADRFATFTGIDIFTLCALLAFEDQSLGETVETVRSIYRLEFTRVK